MGGAINVLAAYGTATGGGGGSYLKLYTLTIDHTQCGSSDSTNFPVLVSLSGTNLKTVANGGFVQNTVSVAGITVPADLVFSSDNAGASPYSWEVEFYDPVNGILIAWVQVPTVSHTTNTVFYMPYDNTAISTFQGGTTGSAWNSGFAGVWHLPNGSTLSALDSTSNANNGTITGITAAAGMIDGGASFPGNISDGISMGTPSTLDISGAVTLSMWTNPSTFPGAAIWAGRWSDNGFGYTILSIGSAIYALIGIPGGSGNYGIQGYSYSTTGVWAYWSMTFIPSTGVFLYLNGTQVASETTSPPSSQTAGAPFQMGIDELVRYAYSGYLDEVRVSNVARSSDWILTEYNNQFNPGNIGSPGFYTVT